MPTFPNTTSRSTAISPKLSSTSSKRSATQDDDKAKQRVQDVLLTLPEALGIDPGDLVVKVRRKHDQGDQYARISQQDTDMIVSEGDLRFVVNVEDRIDTGLFLDHRAVRAYALEHCKGTRMLNLFAYTCSVSVAAAVGGAKQTTSVDLSNTYLDWGKKNFEANGLDPAKHRFIRDDATRWIARDRNSYDWIFINPPTFSRSKMSKGDFNIHKDHKTLIENAMSSLDKKGELLFTTHARAFELDDAITTRFQVEDVNKTIRPPRLHPLPLPSLPPKEKGTVPFSKGLGDSAGVVGWDRLPPKASGQKEVSPLSIGRA